jgi:hypothetical protein
MSAPVNPGTVRYECKKLYDEKEDDVDALPLALATTNCRRAWKWIISSYETTPKATF